MDTNSLLDMLRGTDRRSIGRAEQVAAIVLDTPGRLGEVFEGIFADDPVLRMRAADVVEKVTSREPTLLQPFKTRILEEAAHIEQHEVRWHVAQFISRLELSPDERLAALAILKTFLTDHSRIVKTFAMQAMADLALQDASLRPEVLVVIEELARTGSPAMQSRGRKLLKKLK